MEIESLLSQQSTTLLSRRIEFKPALRKDYYEENLKKKFKPINKIKPNDSPTNSKGKKEESKKDETKKEKVDIVPSQQLYPEEEIGKILKWHRIKKIGAGLQNLGNTCFLNAVLQCLTYTPPLANYCILREHTKKCRASGFCVFCSIERHIEQTLNSSGSCISPRSIASNLKSISKLLRLGRQEDSHEFLRYLVDGLQKSCLQGFEKKLETKIQETTPIHRIFGGYLQSQVQCSLKNGKENHLSNTFDPFLDISLEIKGCDSIEKAFQKFTSPEILDQHNKYKCLKCGKKSQAKKQFTIRKAPYVLTIHLKRFDFTALFGGKINKPVSFKEKLDLSSFLSKDENDHPIYSLYGVLVHFGQTTRSGHYFSFVKNSNDIWYCMDDSSVKQVSLTSVLSQKAYMLFYVRDQVRANIPVPNELQDPVLSSLSDSPGANKKRKAVELDFPSNSLRNFQKKPRLENSSENLQKNSILTTSLENLQKKPRLGTSLDNLQQKPRLETSLENLQKNSILETSLENLQKRPRLGNSSENPQRKPRLTTSLENLQKKPRLEISSENLQENSILTTSLENLQKRPRLEISSKHLQKNLILTTSLENLQKKPRLETSLENLQKKPRLETSSENLQSKNSLDNLQKKSSLETSAPNKPKIMKPSSPKEQPSNSKRALEILKYLTSFETTQTGKEVQYWENADTSMIQVQEKLLTSKEFKAVTKFTDEWDEEYDKGKTKKIKKKRSLFEEASDLNPFQHFYDSKKRKKIHSAKPSNRLGLKKKFFKRNYNKKKKQPRRNK